MRPKHLALALAFLMFGCQHEPPIVPGEVPGAYSGVAQSDAKAWPALDFFSGFGSVELTSLLGEAEAGNTDLAAAAARILEARGQVGIASAALFPSVSIGASESEQGSKGGANQNLPATRDWRSRKSFSVDAGASYELDLWGKNLAVRRAAKAAFVGSQFDRETVALTVTANVANGYFSVLSLRERTALSRVDLDNALRVLAIVQSRVRNGAATPLDLAQQEAVVAGQRAAVPGLEQNERVARASLAVLLGRAPEGFDVDARTLAGLTAPHIAPGLPADLLLRRPDIRSAEAALAGANANIDAARAAFFPVINLTGSGGLQSASLASLASGAGAVYAIGASLAQPIFKGGSLIAGLRQAKARRAELIATYRGAVFQALADVENALGDAANQTDQLRYRADQADASARAFHLAEVRYKEGATDFLAVLDAQRTLYAAQDSLAQARLAALQSQITLFRALGGGWPATTKAGPTR